MKKIFLAIFVIVVLVGSFLVIGSSINKTAYKKGYNQGINDAFNATIDTINSICNRTKENPNKITKLVLINPDTTVYYLSKNKIIIKPKK